MVPTTLLPEGCHVTCTRLVAPKGMDGSDRFRSYSHCLLITENPTIEVLFATSDKEVNLYPSAYSYEDSTLDPLSSQKTKIITDFTTSIDIGEDKKMDGVRRISDPCL